MRGAADRRQPQPVGLHAGGVFGLGSWALGLGPLAPAATPAPDQVLGLRSSVLEVTAGLSKPQDLRPKTQDLSPTPALRLGLQMLRGMGESPAGQIVEGTFRAAVWLARGLRPADGPRPERGLAAGQGGGLRLARARSPRGPLARPGPGPQISPTRSAAVGRTGSGRPAGKRGQSPFVRSTLRAVPANGDCPFSRTARRCSRFRRLRRPKRCWPITAPRACRSGRTRWSSFARDWIGWASLRPGSLPRYPTADRSGWPGLCWCGSGPAPPRGSLSSLWKTRPEWPTW